MKKEPVDQAYARFITNETPRGPASGGMGYLIQYSFVIRRKWRGIIPFRLSSAAVRRSGRRRIEEFGRSLVSKLKYRHENESPRRNQPAMRKAVQREANAKAESIGMNSRASSGL